MVKRVCTDNLRNLEISGWRSSAFRVLAVLWALGWGLALGQPRCCAQAGDAPPTVEPPAADAPATPAEELDPEAKPAEEPTPPSVEAPPEATPDKPADEAKPSPGEADPEKEASPPEIPPASTPESAAKLADENAAAAGKPAVEQPAVTWSDAVAAVVEKKTPEGVQDLRVLEDQVQQVLQHAMPATLGVQLGDAAGSAVIVSADGLVLTAGHVAGIPGREVNCYFADGRIAKGITLGMNRAIDSGMIRLTEPGPWPHVKLAEEVAGLKPGEWVVALGHAGGFDPGRTPPARIGRVLYQNEEIIHTDCALVGGDSGGPLFNLRGQLVGIHSRIGRRITSNFHVPVGTYRQTWDRLVAGEVWGGRLDADEPVRYRPMLGLAVQNGDDHCRVTQVFANGPAKIAGVAAGDLILQFDGKPVKSADELVKLLWQQKPGNKVKLEIEREGKPQSIEVQLGQIAQSFPGSPEPPDDDEES
ncbi:MAG: trypsin-like peptidase domain-containing protein [Pirellulales bacterium]